MTTVVRLLAVDRAAIAEKGLVVGIGAAPDILEAADAGCGKAGRNIAGKIEQGVTGTRTGLEEPLVDCVCRLERAR